MRYIVYGAGGVGSAVGGRLHAAGRNTVLVARGAHYEALDRDGLRLESPSGAELLRVPVVATIADAGPQPDDVVILTMKSQDTAVALDALADVAGPATPVVCLQNGVENERLALRRFADVYGVCVVLPATYLDPGVVQVHARGVWGILDIGRAPSGIDARCRQVAGDLEAAGFSSQATADIMAWKYRKLLINLANALEAACGEEALDSDLGRRLAEEARRCFDRAGIALVSSDEDRRRRTVIEWTTIDGHARQGSSTWQSLVRGTGTTEADYLNGEIALLGRLHGIPTPANALMQEVSRRMARCGQPPHTVSLDSLMAELATADRAAGVD